jgi:hypothetical protein
VETVREWARGENKREMKVKSKEQERNEGKE